jgi:hypothetical protein
MCSGAPEPTHLIALLVAVATIVVNHCRDISTHRISGWAEEQAMRTWVHPSPLFLWTVLVYFSTDDTFDVGEDWGTPVSPAYQPPFPFIGTLKKVTLRALSQ